MRLLLAVGEVVTLFRMILYGEEEVFDSDMKLLKFSFGMSSFDFWQMLDFLELKIEE